MRHVGRVQAQISVRLSEGFYHLKLGYSKMIRQLPSQFHAEGLSVEQRFATSKDGVRVPYFFVHNSDRVRAGTVPTFVLANIRGSGAIAEDLGEQWWFAGWGNHGSKARFVSGR